ncbi:MAG: choice-of-anchor D domain-containing protein [bacterium]
MKKYRFIIYISLLLLALIPLKAQEPVNRLSSYEGLHFMIGFMQNEYEYLQLGIDLKIFIASQETANIVIKYPDRPPFSFVLSPDTVHVENVEGLYENRGNSEVIRKLGIVIHSDVPITVYSFSSQTLSSDCYSAIPIKNWGSEYITVCQPLNKTIERLPSGVDVDVIRESEFMVMAAYDSTVVTITPSDFTGGGQLPNKPFNVLLNTGETYLVKSLYNSGSDGDLTGSLIKSTKPVGVLSGHVRAPMPKSTNSRNHLVEMLPPTFSWGKSYVSVPYGVSQYGDVFRIVAKTIPTTVEVTTDSIVRQYTINNAKGYIEIEGISQPSTWTSNNPVEIAQLMAHLDANDPSWRDFDPCMALLSPSDQFVRHVMFQTPGNIFKNPNQYQHHYTSIALEKTAKSTLRLDGKRLDSAGLAIFRPIKGTNLLWTRIELNQGTHVLESTTGSFSGVLFATGLYDAYALVLGASLKIPGTVDSLPPVITLTENCGTVHIEVKDKLAPAASGLLYATINKFRSYNFEWNVQEFKYTDSIAIIDAQVKNPYIQGKLVIYAQDKDGNIKEQEFIYYRTDIKLPTAFDFGVVNWHDSVCKAKSLVNYSNKTYKIISARIEADSRLSLYTDKKLPATLDKGGILNFNICFKPSFDSTAVNSKLIIEMDCGKTDTVDVSALVRAPALLAQGYNFGNLLAGETADGIIGIQNNGNIDISIDTMITSGDENQFVIDRAALPLVLHSSSDTTIKAQFTPTARGSFSLNGEFKNSADIPNGFILTGIGLAPEFDSLFVDLGERRIGHYADTLMTITNKGDYLGDLFFTKFLTKSIDDTTSAFLNSFSAIGLPPAENIEMKIPIQIANVGNYRVSGEYKTNCKIHPPVAIEIIGVGTIPVCKTNDILINDTDIYSETDSSAVIIEAAGNEILTIHSVTPIAPIIGEFEYDLTALQGIKIPVGSNTKLDIKFKPTVGGMHEQKFLVVSDAAPDYGSKNDTITISAKAVVPDIEKIVIEFAADPFVNCQTNVLNVKITNNGSKIVNLDEIKVTAQPLNLNWKIVQDINQDIPQVMAPGTVYSFDIEIFPLSGTTSTINVAALIFGTEKISGEYEFTPKESAALIFSAPELKLEIGKEYTLDFNGSFPHKIEKEISFNLEINLPSNSFYIDTTKEVWLVLDNNQKYKLNLDRQDDKIVFSYPNIQPEGLTNWNLKFDILTLLDKESQFSLVAKVNFDDCYLNSENNFMVIFEEICSKDLRLIKINSNLLSMQVLPNPIKNELNIDLNIPRQSTVDINLYDIRGKKITLSEKLVLQIGKHLLIYNFVDVPNGIYRLELSSQEYMKRIVVIINK